MMRNVAWTLVFLGMLSQSGCGMFKTELDKCREQREYQDARTGTRAQVPSDLEQLPQESWVAVPEGSTNTTPTPEDEPCLIEPPEYRRN